MQTVMRWCQKQYMALSKWHLSTASNISRSEISGLVPVLVDVSGISCRHAKGQGMEKGMTPANMSTSSRTPLGTPQRLPDGSRTPDCRNQHAEWLYTEDCRQDWKSSQKLLPNLTDKTKYVCYHRTLVTKSFCTSASCPIRLVIIYTYILRVRQQL